MMLSTHILGYRNIPNSSKGFAYAVSNALLRTFKLTIGAKMNKLRLLEPSEPLFYDNGMAVSRPNLKHILYGS